MNESQSTVPETNRIFPAVREGTYEAGLSGKKDRAITQIHARREFSNAPKRLTIDTRIDALKILAQALLQRIESLEAQAGEDESCDLDLHSEVQRFEAELIRSALIRTGGRQRRAARLLNMKVTTLNNKIKRYGIG